MSDVSRAFIVVLTIVCGFRSLDLLALFKLLFAPFPLCYYLCMCFNGMELSDRLWEGKVHPSRHPKRVA